MNGPGRDTPYINVVNERPSKHAPDSCTVLYGLNRGSLLELAQSSMTPPPQMGEKPQQYRIELPGLLPEVAPKLHGVDPAPSRNGNAWPPAGSGAEATRSRPGAITDNTW